MKMFAATWWIGYDELSSWTDAHRDGASPCEAQDVD
jgi:hypothetical protein